MATDCGLTKALVTKALLNWALLTRAENLDGSDWPVLCWATWQFPPSAALQRAHTSHRPSFQQLRARELPKEEISKKFLGLQPEFGSWPPQKHPVTVRFLAHGAVPPCLVLA